MYQICYHRTNAATRAGDSREQAEPAASHAFSTRAMFHLLAHLIQQKRKVCNFANHSPEVTGESWRKLEDNLEDIDLSKGVCAGRSDKSNAHQERLHSRR